jgi:hypothetical protein
MSSSRVFVCLGLVAAALLAGCDMLGLESATAIAAQREAEGKAVGGACRHAGRAIEDCYALNRKADKAAIFAGWREMNDYMRENKIEPVAPQLTPPTEVAKASPPADPPAEEPKKPAAGADKPEKGEARPAKAAEAKHQS